MSALEQALPIIIVCCSILGNTAARCRAWHKPPAVTYAAASGITLPTGRQDDRQNRHGEAYVVFTLSVHSLARILPHLLASSKPYVRRLDACGPGVGVARVDSQGQ